MKRPAWRVAFLLALSALLSAGAALETPVADAAQRGELDTVRELLRRGEDVNAAQGDGMTALHWAAERGDAELGRVLIYAGANVDAGTRIGRYTPLHIGARSGRTEIVGLLLEAKADPNVATRNSGATPLHLAAASGDPGAVAALLEHGATVDALEGVWGQTPLVFAAANNRVAAIHLLLDAGADVSVQSRVVDVKEQADADRAAERRLSEFLDEFRDREGGGLDWRPRPSQVQAAIEAAREIQRKWPDVPKPGESQARAAQEGEEEQSGETAPSEADASAASPADSVEVAGATEPELTGEVLEDPEAEGQPDEEEAPRPLTYPQMVQTWGGLTPLLHAVRQGHVEAALALLDRGADIDQASAGDQTTPLLMAAVNGQFDLSLELLARGADPNRPGVAGVAPLFAVLERQWAPRASYAHPTEHQQQNATHVDVMKALLEAGADPNARLTAHLWFMEYTFAVLRGSGIDMGGATPFWRAAYALDVDAMRLLNAYGADPSIPTVKPPQRRRRAPAEEENPKEDEGEEKIQVAEGDSVAAGEEAESETHAEATAKDARPEGNPTKANAEGESAEEGEGGSDPEDEDRSGVPPVPVGGPAIHPIHAASGVGYGQSFAGNAHRYVPNNWLAAVKFLVEECGADVNARDANAYTALHHAASRGDNELILYLVEKGADVTVMSRKGQTTADMANGPIQRVTPYPETIALLERLGSKNNHKCVSC